jgi:uncharacterized protein
MNKKIKIKKKTSRGRTDKYVCFSPEDQPAMDAAYNLYQEKEAKEITDDPDKLFQFCAKSTFSLAELDIMEKVNKIMEKKDTKSFTIDPNSMHGAADEFGGSDFDDWGPLVTPEQDEAIKNMYRHIPGPKTKSTANGSHFNGGGVDDGFDPKAPWIQTYSGRRFNPTKPNPDAIVLQDIAHALSMQCRFSGHCRDFYSVAQHSVLVSHICNEEDALWGLLHDASEAYLVDVPRPLKQSGKFQAYIDFETVMQRAVCTRFGLSELEPPSVKRADKILLATEARDLMGPLRPDWKQPVDPLPFTIEPWEPKRAESEFLNRYNILISR